MKRILIKNVESFIPSSLTKVDFFSFFILVIFVVEEKTTLSGSKWLGEFPRDGRERIFCRDQGDLAH